MMMIIIIIIIIIHKCAFRGQNPEIIVTVLLDCGGGRADELSFLPFLISL